MAPENGGQAETQEELPLSEAPEGTEGTEESTLQEGAIEPEEPEAPAEEEEIPPGVARLVEEARREAREAREALQEIREANRRPDPVDVPPVDPNNIQTMDQLRQYNEWLIRKEFGALSASQRSTAESVASEQRARGILSPSNVGAGYDFDAMVGKHISPIERANPSFRQAMSHMKDPAMARYAVAVALEATEKFGGDPAKGFKALAHFLGSKARGDQEVFDKVKTGIARQQILRGGQRKSGPNGPQVPVYTSEQVDKATPRRYLEMKQEVRSGKARWATEQ